MDTAMGLCHSWKQLFVTICYSNTMLLNISSYHNRANSTEDSGYKLIIFHSTSNCTVCLSITNPYFQMNSREEIIVAKVQMKLCFTPKRERNCVSSIPFDFLPYTVEFGNLYIREDSTFSRTCFRQHSKTQCTNYKSTWQTEACFL